MWRECTEAYMANQFQEQEDFCAGIKIGIDLACQLGMGVRDLPQSRFQIPVKALCAAYEAIFGRPLPGTKPPECNDPRSAFYEKCVIGTTVGERNSMPCKPGTTDEIRRTYQRWPGRGQ